MSENNNYNFDKQNDTEMIHLTSIEYNQILNLQQQILEMLSTNINTSQILSKLCLLAESLLPNSVASIMLKNKEDGLMSIKAAPSIPQNGQDRLANLKPGPTGGSCGNAVFKNLPQFVKNTFTDKRWAGLKEVAIDFTSVLVGLFQLEIKKKMLLVLLLFHLLNTVLLINFIKNYLKQPLQ